MAVIAKAGEPTVTTRTPPANEQIPGLLAGEEIASGDVCFVDTDGLVYRANVGDDTPRGVSAGRSQIGEAITLYRNVRYGYGTGLTPGSDVYLGANGALDTAADGTANNEPIGWCVDEQRIQFTGF